MTHKERAFAALERRIPDRVPTFELEFQLSKEMFGVPLIPKELTDARIINNMSEKELDAKIYEMAQTAVYVYGELDYSIIPLKTLGLDWEFNVSPEYVKYIKYIKELTNNSVALAGYGDGTFSVPDGDKMYEFAYRTVDDPDGLRAEAKAKADFAVERNKRLAEAGVDVILLCDDYCYNTGPFLSPAMFSEFIQPYLYHIIEEGRKDGMYMVKHTDGNIMPIIDQLVECNPHALHSLDPMAGVDIKEVKEKYGGKVALCGNVHCAAMQTGTDEEVIKSAEYCLTYGKPNGGYLFCTSNIPFKGMPVERYRMILDIWKRMRDY